MRWAGRPKGSKQDHRLYDLLAFAPRQPLDDLIRVSPCRLFMALGMALRLHQSPWAAFLKLFAQPWPREEGAEARLQGGFEV